MISRISLAFLVIATLSALADSQHVSFGTNDIPKTDGMELDRYRRLEKQQESEEQAEGKPTLAPLHIDIGSEIAQEKGTKPNFYSSSEYSLFASLLLRSNYSRDVRPVLKHLNPIVVKVGMCVMMIEDLIEREQTMVTSACVKMIWVDEFLTWDPGMYGNLTWLAISSQLIWLPDIAIINSPDPHALTRKSTNIGVSYLGEVGFYPSGRLATRCNLMITYFPFDWQNCEVRFESWIYPTDYLVMELYPGEEAIDIKEYYSNFQWWLKSSTALVQNVVYDGRNFSSLTVTFRLHRKPQFYFMYFIFPQLLLATLQCISPILPVEHPGRMAMLTALFIGTSVTHAGITDHIPKSSNTMSLLQIYMTLLSVNLVAALLITFVMLYTVLRYPKCEPSFQAMMAALFYINWPAKGRRHSSALLGDSIDLFNKKRETTRKFCCHICKSLGIPIRKKILGNYRLPYYYGRDSIAVTKPTTGEKVILLKNRPVDSEEEMSPNSLDESADEKRKKTATKGPHSAAFVGVVNRKASSSPVSNKRNGDEKIWQPRAVVKLNGNRNARQVRYRTPSKDELYCENPLKSCKTCRGIHYPNSNVEARKLSTTSDALHAISWSPRKDAIKRNEDVEDIEFKRRWVKYCVALDKCYMYASVAWNITLPVVLFALLPLLHGCDDRDNDAA